jgi:hypothetical protein
MKILQLPWSRRCPLVNTPHLNFQLNCSQSQSHVTTDDQSASLSWNKAPIWGLRPDFHHCQTIAGYASGWTQQKTSPPTIQQSFYCHGMLPSDRLGIVSAGNVSTEPLPSNACSFTVTVLHVTIFTYLMITFHSFV